MVISSGAYTGCRIRHNTKTINDESGGGAETDKYSAEKEKKYCENDETAGPKKLPKLVSTKHSMREIVRLTGNGFSIVFMMIEQFKNAQFEELIKK